MADLVTEWALNDLMDASRLNDQRIHSLWVQPAAAGVVGLKVWHRDAVDTANLFEARTQADALLFSISETGALIPTDANDLGTAALRWDLFSSDVRLYNAASDANPSVRLNALSILLGPGGATAPDVGLSRGAANRLDLATGDSLNLVSGQFLIAGTAIFDTDRDVLITLLPAADAQDLGSAAFRWDLFGADIRSYSAASEANPTIKLVGGVLSFGLNSADALSVSLSAGAANRLDLATGDSLNLVSGNLQVAGVTVLDASQNLTINGNAILGDAAADVVTIKGTPANNIGSFQRAVSASTNVPATGNTDIVVTWPTAWGDTAYKFWLGWEKGAAGTLTTVVCAGVSARASDTITVQFRGGTAVTGTDIIVHVFGWND